MLKIAAVAAIVSTASWCGEEPSYPELPPQEGAPVLYLGLANDTDAVRRCALTYATGGVGGAVVTPSALISPRSVQWVAVETGAAQVTISAQCFHPDNPDAEHGSRSDKYRVERNMSCLALYGAGLDTEFGVSIPCWLGEP